ncbi:MAG TPA: alpha/beta fold hydrolase [Actinomycetota bacterium]|nr:alpha/beta fold hydrolase [Actinomycetota bacterium]
MGRTASLFLAGSLAALAATPAGRGTAKGALVLCEILPSPVHPLSAVSPAPRVTRISLPHGEADLYEGRPGAPGVVVVHGANVGGITDPRIAGLAGAFCRVGRTVMAPALVLAERRLDMADLARIRDAIDALADQTGPVVVVTFSYGSALALCALAERPSIQGRVRALATIGTYFDLVHVIEGVTTGSVVVDGVLHPWAPPASALGQVTPLLAGFLGGEEASAIQKALATDDPAGLSAGAAAVYHVITNRNPRRVVGLVADLPEPIRGTLERLSPAAHIDGVRVPVFALHSRLDPAAPAIESVELVRAIRRRGRARLTLVGAFNHVTPAGGHLSRLRDAPGLVRFAGTLLRAQEAWVPGTARRPPGQRRPAHPARVAAPVGGPGGPPPQQ